VLTSTSGAEITCADQDYASSTYGAAFQACLTCELSSTYVDPQSNMSDLQAALYNVRFALSWCLFGYDNNTGVTDPCLTTFVASAPVVIIYADPSGVYRLSCGPLNVTFEADLTNPNADPYGYCTDFNQTTISEPKCVPCLAETGTSSYLSNCKPYRNPLRSNE
jgi:hypothetical protein